MQSIAVFGVLVNLRPDQNPTPSQAPATAPISRQREKVTFSQDFRQFFLRGLAALLPTLITLWLVVWAWNFLWESLGRHLIWALKYAWGNLAGKWVIPEAPSWGYIDHYWDERSFTTRLLGVLLAVVLVYIVGFFVGNLIGRTFWKLGENLVMKIPIIRAIYPAVKQVTDFLLADRTRQFEFSRVVAVQPHEKGIWSIGLVTGQGLRPLAETTGQEMVTVFVPSSPTAFSGYVLVVPRNEVVELPISVEEAMRLLISGGVIVPGNEVVIGGGGGSGVGSSSSSSAAGIFTRFTQPVADERANLSPLPPPAQPQPNGS